MARPDGIDLDLIKEGLLLALEHGNLLPGDDTKVRQALHVLSQHGYRTEVEARGIATRLATVRTSTVDPDAMTASEQVTWRRAIVHAYEAMRGEQSRPDAAWTQRG
jgi:hypothetical protein